MFLVTLLRGGPYKLGAFELDPLALRSSGLNLFNSHDLGSPWVPWKTSQQFADIFTFE